MRPVASLLALLASGCGAAHVPPHPALAMCARLSPQYTELPTTSALAARSRRVSIQLTDADRACITESDLAWLDHLDARGDLARLRDGTCRDWRTDGCLSTVHVVDAIERSREVIGNDGARRLDAWMAQHGLAQPSPRCDGNVRARAVEAALRVSGPLGREYRIDADLAECVGATTLQGPVHFVPPTRGPGCFVHVMTRACPPPSPPTADGGGGGGGCCGPDTFLVEQGCIVDPLAGQGTDICVRYDRATHAFTTEWVGAWMS